MFYKHIALVFCITLFSSHMLLPIVEAGGHNHGNNQQGLAVLLAAGLLAKILGHHKHEEHHVHIPVPVHHEHHEHHKHHGSGSARIYVQHPSPFYNVHGGMMGAPSMVQRYVFPSPQYGYPNPPY